MKLSTEQKTVFDFYEYKIGQHFACALEYGDFGDMSDAEIREFNEWLENEQEGKTGHWSIEDTGENWGRCAITGLLSNRMIVRFNFRI